MKIVLDLSRLLEQGKLTPEEAERLRGLAAADTGAFAISLLVGLGVIAVSAGAVALVPRPETALMLGVAMFAIGHGFTLQGKERWSLLAQIFVVVGALMFSAGVLTIGKGALAAMLIVAAALAGASIVARSSLLMAAAVLGLGACLGARSGYWHATYMLAIYEPLVTIVLFSLLALGTYYLSRSLSSDYERLALIAARTSVFMVNFGFWIGSLWGDNLVLIRSLLRGDPSIDYSTSSQVIPPLVFVIGWAVALLSVGIWGVRANRRWVVNIAAVFGAIHFYTQWFERQKMSPQEVKEEFRQAEGDPVVKGKLRQLRTARMRKRVMAAVPKASVVITNPTHYAIALRYERGMNAPICVAKGVDLIARKIREIAEEHSIPVIENPPLARALHATVEIDQEIPQEHYRAVAEIIGYIMRLRRMAAPYRRL